MASLSLTVGRRRSTRKQFLPRHSGAPYLRSSPMEHPIPSQKRLTVPSGSQQQADLFRRLHSKGRILVLVNAWDAASARVVEHGGADAIATTSAGMAWSLGYADGEQMPRDEFVAACARICRVTRVPVSVDIESGFGSTTDQVCELVGRLLELGVVGINIEDGMSSETRRLLAPETLCERIARLRALALQSKVGLLINARTDAYFAVDDAPAGRFEEALRRARMFAAAGADGIFVPGMDKIDEVQRFAQAVELPLNVYAGYEGVPTVDALSAAGVRRVSLGCGPFQSALGLLGRIAAESFSQGRYSAMATGMAKVSEMNRLFPRSELAEK